MAFKAWQFAALEEYGYMDTDDGLINCVARQLAESSNDTIDTAEFRSVCITSGVDPDSFTQSDLDKLQRKMNEIAYTKTI